MFFNKNKTIKLNLTPNTLYHFSRVDTLLQTLAFSDGYFDGAFEYFRFHYFTLINSKMKKMSHEEKLRHANEVVVIDRRTLAALANVLKEEVFDSYLNKMYDEEEQKEIRKEIVNYRKRVPVDPITAVTRRK